MKRLLLLTGLLIGCKLTTALGKGTRVSGFIENKGQIIDQDNKPNFSVKYLLCSGGLKLQLMNNSFSYEVIKAEKLSRKLRLPENLSSSRKYEGLKDSFQYFSHRIDVFLEGADNQTILVADEVLPEVLNFFTVGTPVEGVTNVHQFGKVTYKNVYPNIDLEFVTESVTGGKVKYNFIVRPGGDVSKIQLRYNGASEVNLMNDLLNIHTSCGILEEAIPESYILETGKMVKVRFRQLEENLFGFTVQGSYSTETLIIDPWATYFGWDGNTGLLSTGSLATDQSNNIIAGGITAIQSNIATSGAYQTIYGGGSWDAYIRKFNASGNPQWCTYYGGGASDYLGGIVCDEAGNFYTAGYTQSINNIATPGSHQPVYPDSTYYASFFAKFNSSGIRQWATYYPMAGGPIVRDHQGNLILGGNGAGWSGVATAGAHQTTPSGNSDNCIVKFNSDGQRIWGTYYGGSNGEFGGSVAVDANDNIFLAGTTSSSNNIATAGSHQPVYADCSDNFLVKFNSSGVRLWGTYLGGTYCEQDIPYITTDINGNVFMGGQGASPGVFATPGAFQSTPSLGVDKTAYLTKFSGAGQRLWGTYFGGEADDFLYDIKTDAQGNVLFVGETRSTSVIASSNGWMPNNQGGIDGFIEKFSPTGTRIWGTYFGAADNDVIYGFTLNASKNIIIAGVTMSSSGIATPGAYATNLLSSSVGDCFLASLDSNGSLTTPVFELPGLSSSLIKVFPNPAKDIVQVSLPASAEGTITVSDAMGKVIKSVTVKTQELTIDLKGLAAGVYLLEYKSEQMSETVKLIKE